jgi:AbiU2
MSAHSKEVAKEFCVLCDWLMQSWAMRKHLFDDNPDLEELRRPRYAHFFYRLHTMTQEYWLHQLAKLHDPAVQGGSSGHINLSVDYMVDYGQWDEETKGVLTDLRNRMLVLAKPIKDVRNKILSHNDLATILESRELGGFDPGEDEAYFCCLRQFALIVSKTVTGEPFVYDDLVKNDVEVFMHCFNRGIEALGHRKARGTGR